VAYAGGKIQHLNLDLDDGTEAKRLETEWAQVLSRLDGVEPTEGIKATFELFVKGEATLQELNAAIDAYFEQDQSRRDRSQ
jgi:hypothetical protein